jgi:hypothetical protein
VLPRAVRLAGCRLSGGLSLCLHLAPAGDGASYAVCLSQCLSHGCVRIFTCRHARETGDETNRETITDGEYLGCWSGHGGPP